MNSILLIIDYIFKKKNVNHTPDKSISSFFSNGISFPLFMESIFNVKIENINWSPSSEMQKESNNNLALKFLFQNNAIIKSLNPHFTTENDQINLLKLILTEQCFQIDINDIILFCNYAVDIDMPEINDLEEICNVNFLTTLLSYLTNGLVKPDNNNNNKFNKAFINNFKIAKVPLVIDKDSFLEPNRYQICIQIIIIAEHFKDNPSYSLAFSRQSGFNEDNDEDFDVVECEEDFEEEADPNNVLLRIINIIGQSGGFEFNGFYQISKHNSIPKYVMYFFNIKSIPNVDLKKNKKLKNIRSVIDFLKKKESKFEILSFDFVNSKRTSVITFFVNFLNFFFLRNFNQEIDTRVNNILCMKNSNLNLDKPSKTIALLHLIKYKNLNIDLTNLKITNKLLFKYLGDNCYIPQVVIIDNNTKNDKKKKKERDDYVDQWDYQLRFILDAIDYDYKSIHVFEYILTALNTIKSIKVPPIDVIISSIKAKKVSLKFQNLRSEQITNSDQISQSKNVDGQKNITKKIHEPKTFLKRIKKNQKYKNFKKSKKKEKLEDNDNYFVKKEKPNFEIFWSPLTPTYTVLNGVLYDTSKYDADKARQNWIKQFTEIQQKFLQDEKTTSDEDDNNNEPLRYMRRSRLYRLLNYNRADQRWSLNPRTFEEFALDSGIKSKSIKAPLILLMTPDDKTFASYFLKGSYPELINDFYVYGFCEKTLNQINSDESFNEEKDSIKPVFLMVNIASAQRELPKLKTILTKIYTFLFSICDLEIMIVDKDHYEGQIELMKLLNNIISEFLKANKMKSKEQENKVIEKSENRDYVDYSKGLNFNYENDEIDTDSWENLNDYDIDDDDDDDNEYNYNYCGNYSSKEIVFKNPKLIFLVNESTVKYNEKVDQYLPKNSFFADFISQIGNKNKIHYITFNDFNTYKPFLNSLNEMLINCSTRYYDIRHYFYFIKKNNLSETYFDMKSDTSTWKDKLKKFIYQRYSQRKSNKTEDWSPYASLFNIRKEISKFLPISFDKPISIECESILLNLKQEAMKENRGIYIAELKESADSHLKFIKQSINTKIYLTEEQIHNIKDSHISFLKEEFFSIIKILNFGEFLDIAYEDNYDIVEKQIKNDSEKMNEMFSEFVDKIQIRKTAMEFDTKVGFQRGSNYSMKETENLNEIKVAVEIGQDLKSIIEQDF